MKNLTPRRSQRRSASRQPHQSQRNFKPKEKKQISDPVSRNNDTFEVSDPDLKFGGSYFNDFSGITADLKQNVMEKSNHNKTKGSGDS